MSYDPATMDTDAYWERRRELIEGPEPELDTTCPECGGELEEDFMGDLRPCRTCRPEEYDD